ncbi:class II fructose-bisphosphate aldolase [Mesobacillus foraminis]|uniref:Fructose-bisphosphate aldolase class II n=1 Tax=Mesobacillus foraminis TaxID=279826 RepID=A0A4R2BLI7_9BACI|nr:class II fructose-bisphosphate aldolase [Mesobacillus foraminis]TCN27412.1 fructose-bisphosphate aldolase class II [Mesobacillus foraminis]
MLLNTMDILIDAEKHNYAAAAFSVYNWETVNAAVEAAEKANTPVILALAERYLDYIDIDVFAAMARVRAEKAIVPVSIHMDHAYKKESIKKAISAGFSSVMFDGSHLPFEENVQQTKEIVEVAHRAGVSVEAELGSIAIGKHSDEEAAENVLTDPQMARLFVEETKIDFLAPAIGTVHGMYAAEPNIDLARLSKIRECTDIPQVLHGGSGTPGDFILAAINSGIRKININTEVSIAAVENARKTLEDHSSKGALPHLSVVNKDMQAAMITVMEKYLLLFSNGLLASNN